MIAEAESLSEQEDRILHTSEGIGLWKERGTLSTIMGSKPQSRDTSAGGLLIPGWEDERIPVYFFQWKNKERSSTENTEKEEI